MRRVCVIGVTGAGKTTVSRRLADLLGVPHVELDALNWQDGWVDTVGTPAFEARVSAAVAGDGWVVDGSYSAIRHLIWPRADTVVWLDPPFRVAFGRLLRRTARRVRSGETLWDTDNRESARLVLLSRDSILWWQLKTFRRRRREYPRQFAEPAHRHLRVLRLRTDAEVEAVLAGIET